MEQLLSFFFKVYSLLYSVIPLMVLLPQVLFFRLNANSYFLTIILTAFVSQCTVLTDHIFHICYTTKTEKSNTRLVIITKQVSRISRPNLQEKCFDLNNFIHSCNTCLSFFPSKSQSLLIRPGTHTAVFIYFGLLTIATHKVQHLHSNRLIRIINSFADQYNANHSRVW